MERKKDSTHPDAHHVTTVVQLNVNDTQVAVQEKRGKSGNAYWLCMCVTPKKCRQEHNQKEPCTTTSEATAALLYKHLLKSKPTQLGQTAFCGRADRQIGARRHTKAQHRIRDTCTGCSCFVQILLATTLLQQDCLSATYALQE